MSTSVQDEIELEEPDDADDDVEVGESNDETDRVIRAVASGDLSEGDFRDWIADRCG